MSIDGQRRHQVDGIVLRARRLTGSHPDVRAVVVVGSYAYGCPTMESDIDIVMAINNRDAWLLDDSWARHIVGTRLELVREQDWGPLRERRYRTESGFEVEFGLVTAQWFATPVDPGTAKVLSDGCRIVTDAESLARDALRALALPTTEWTTAGRTGPAEPPASQP
ncbi:MAG: nucleotidyltransferase domain-containing protein [Microthrixaceae bacterium]